MRILFAGTPEFSVPPLQALLDSDHQVVGVYTQPDRPSGRGRKLTPSPVKQLAVTHGVPVQQPENFRSEEAVFALQNFGADLMVVVAYGLLLPQSVLDAPRLGCINIHASLLPRWRGAAPIQRAIAANDPESGISIMQMAAGLDTGPVHWVRTCSLAPRETGASLHDRLSFLGAEALMEALPLLTQSGHQPQPQDDSLTCYAHKLKKKEAFLDWSQSAVVLDRQVRAFDPWPVAQTGYGEGIVRIWSAEPLSSTSNQPPGTILKCDRQGLEVATGQGILRVTRLQMPGKRAMAVAEFANAHCLTGTFLVPE